MVKVVIEGTSQKKEGQRLSRIASTARITVKIMTVDLAVFDVQAFARSLPPPPRYSAAAMKLA